MSQTPDSVWLAAQLERAYQMRDVFEQLWSETQAGRGVTVEDRIAAASVRQSVETWIAHFHRQLRELASRGGHGHPVRSHRVPRPHATSASVGAGGADANLRGA